jgi:hypothetical protein
MDQGEPDQGPFPPPRTEKPGEASWREDHDVTESNDAAHELQEDVRRRYEAGEFYSAIEAFETAPFEEYTKHVGTAVPVQADDTDNRYYVSPDGDLHLCLDRSTDEEHLVRICTLNRTRDKVV